MEKYNQIVAWRTIAANVVQLTIPTVDDPASYRITVKPIDTNDKGQGLKEIGDVFTDFLGIPFPIIDTGINTIDVSDVFRHGCPSSGNNGYIHKSAYKGFSLYLPSHAFKHLHPTALQTNNQYSMSILWANDPNARRIEFTNIDQPGIVDYRADLIDSNGATFNPMEDYGQNPQFEIYQELESGVHARIPIDPVITKSLVDGLIDSVLFSGTGEEITGYLIIKK